MNSSLPSAQKEKEQNKGGHCHWSFPCWPAERELGTWQDEGLEESSAWGRGGLGTNLLAARKCQGENSSLDFCHLMGTWDKKQPNFPVEVLSLHFTFSIMREAALEEYPIFPGSVVQSWHGGVVCPYYKHSYYSVVLARGCSVVKDDYYNQK